MKPTVTDQRNTLIAILKEALLVFVLTTLVGVTMHTFTHLGLLYNLTYAWSIGGSIFSISHLLRLIYGYSAKSALQYLFSVPLGSFVGVVLGTYLHGADPLEILENHPDIIVTAATAALVFGTAITYYLYSRQRIIETQHTAERAVAQQVRNEQQLVQTELKLLQAQIEPHFLFNTLSNVQELIETDPEKASAMLTSFTVLLSASLRRTRRKTSTLADELELIEALLSIHAIRMGERLSYQIDADPTDGGLELPPLLIQPLVENAIQHGLEPKSAGGFVQVRVTKSDSELSIEVADSGMGLKPDQPSPTGVGISNIRNRLQQLYPLQARLEFKENIPHGLRARLTLPLNKSA